MANKIDEATAEKEFQEMMENWNGFVRVPTVEMLEQMKYKVSLEKLFKPKELKKLCKLERKRMKKISDRLSLMFVIGMPLPSENALRVKVGLLPRRKFVVKKDTNDDADEETWKPSIPKATKSHLLSMTEYAKRQKFILMKCMVSADGGKTDVKKCKEEMSKLMSSWPREMLQTLDDSVDKPKKNEKSQAAQDTKKGDEETQHYSTRGIQRNYTEPEAPEDDHYLYCDVCEKLDEGDCPTHGPYTKVPNSLVKWGLTDRARRTCPDGISIAPSKIRSGGLGVWADQDFPRNSVFGPYEGVDIHRDDMQKWKLIFDGGCAWEIYKKGKLSHYLDGSNLKKSNWLRYVNCARNEEEQNVLAYQYKGEIYYQAYKDIKKGMELLVWYGQQYAEQLGITAKKIAPAKVPLFKIPESYRKCEKCGRLFADEEVFRRHMKAKHPDRSVVKRHKCEFCSYSCDRSDDLKRHIRVHTKEKPFQCTACLKNFTLKGSLTRHLRTHTIERPYECNKCGKRFNQLSNMQTHIRTVHDTCKSCVCNVCGFVCGRLIHLNTHMLTHTGQRNYKCLYCDRRFSQSSTMQRHMRIHTGECNYKCRYCDRRFAHSSTMQRHMRIHTGEKPHKCRYCDRRFARSSHMQSHTRIHTGEKPHKCKECSAAFTTSSNLRRHVINRHAKM